MQVFQQYFVVFYFVFFYFSYVVSVVEFELGSDVFDGMEQMDVVFIVFCCVFQVRDFSFDMDYFSKDGIVMELFDVFDFVVVFDQFLNRLFEWVEDLLSFVVQG